MNRQHISLNNNFPFVITRWKTIVILICTIPFFTWVSPYEPFLFYILIVIMAAPLVKKVSLLWLAKLLIVIFLIISHMNNINIVYNLMAVFLADVCAYFVGSVYYKFKFEEILNLIWKMSTICIFLGFLFSIFGSYFIGLVNPITSILAGERLLLLTTPGSGHSVLIELASLALITALSGLFTGIALWWRVLLLSILLFLSASVTAILCLSVILLINISESSYFSVRLRNFIVLGWISTVVIILLNQDTFNSSLGYIRKEILHQDITAYNEDYSTGRAELNQLLIGVSNRHALIGAGEDDPILKYGVTYGTDKEKGATNESMFKLSAKYGWLIMIVSFFISIIPFIVAFCVKRYRKMFLMIGGVLFVLNFSNGYFIGPQSSYYYLFLPLIWMGWLQLTKYRESKLKVS